MALLSVAKRKEYFKALGFGEYNKDSILKLQKKYFNRKKDQDGVYGTDTDNLLRHVYNVTFFSKNFKPQEFICDCGGKYCTGYPTFMKRVQMKHLQEIRDHYGRPMKITSGLRCRTRNRRVGGIPNSLHLSGYATDFYMKGVTDSLNNRRKAIDWIKKLKNHHYTYGDGCSSVKRRNPKASYMGNALHTDTTKAVVISSPKPTPKPASKKSKEPTTEEVLVAKAKELAWPKGTPSGKYKWRGGTATKAFKTALDKYYPKHNQWGQKAARLGCSCDVFVGTVLRASKLEPGSPRGLREQYAFKPKNFKRTVYKNVAPIKVSKDGDVVMYKKSNGGGHILIRGDKGIYEAGFENTYGHYTTNMDKIKTIRPYVVVWSAKPKEVAK